MRIQEVHPHRKLAECVEEYSELLKQSPADNIAQNNLAACYAGLCDMCKALEAAKRAVEIAPKDLLARNNYSLYELRVSQV